MRQRIRASDQGDGADAEILVLGGVDTEGRTGQTVTEPSSVVLVEPRQWRNTPLPYDCPKCDERVSY